MLKYFWTLPQIIFLALFDVIFFLNDTSAYTANQWWCFALLHTAFVIEIVALILLRKLKTLPFSKKTHPIIAFTVVFLCHALSATILCLIPSIQFNVVLVVNLAFIALELVLLGYLLLVRLYRAKKEEASNPKPKEEAAPAPEKLESTSLKTLKQFLETDTSLEFAMTAEELDSFKELTSLAKSYTYEELEYTEKELKKQLNALRTFLANNDSDSVLDTIENIKSVLASRESQISEVENG